MDPTTFVAGDTVRYSGPHGGDPATVVYAVPDADGCIVVAWHGTNYGVVHPSELTKEASVPAADNLRREYVAAPKNVTDDLLTAMLNASDLLEAMDALHQPIPNPYDSSPDSLCGDCLHFWPCPTTRLLHPEEADRG
jgi:hypothetical protein